jgi:AraC-like DNA-binding protein
MNILEETEPLTATVRALARSYPKGSDIPLHRHPWGQLIYARDGVMTVTVAGEARPGIWVVPPQRALCVPAETDHWIRCGTRLAMRTLYVAPLAGALPATCCVVNVPPLLRELIIESVEAPGPARRRRLLTSLILDEIRAATVAPLHLPEPTDPRLVPITSALRDQPGDGRTLAAWARQAGASTRTLSRLFLAQTGMTFRQWQRQARLLAALVRLAEGAQVTTVALDLGYDSPSAFISAFRRSLGKTPRRYFDA